MLTQCMCETNMKYGFLVFVRLIGTIYFKKHIACFHHDSSRVLYNSMPCEDPDTQHRRWLSTISSTVWERVEFEDQLPPSWEALWRHWLRSCWVSNMWSQACCSSYTLQDISDIGWKIRDGILEIDWDDPDNMELVRESVYILLKGCSCKKGCTSRRCSCVKADRKCGPGCRCSNCQNVMCVSGAPPSTDDDIEEEELVEEQVVTHGYSNELVEDDEDDDVVDGLGAGHLACF